MARYHQNKEISEAIEYALSFGFRIEETGRSGHAALILLCPEPSYVRSRAEKGIESRSGRPRETLAITPTTSDDSSTAIRTRSSPRVSEVLENHMKTHWFKVVTDAKYLDELPLDSLFEAGCDDGSPSSGDGVAYVDFYRDAESLEDAIRSAIRDVSAGLKAAGSPHRVIRVEMEPSSLVTADETRPTAV